MEESEKNTTEIISTSPDEIAGFEKKNMICKICGEESLWYDSSEILGKYKIAYFKCPHCGFIQTEKPYWLDEAYSSAITSSDIGLIRRNILLAQRLDILLKCGLGGAKTFLDYGGGYGMFVRMMRDKGWDFEWYDEYCQNLFAQLHEKSRNHYDLITAFELLEHLPNPVDVLDRIFKLGDNAVFRTVLLPNPSPKVKEWAYFGTEHGQHVSFYSLDSLKILAKRYNKYYFSAYHLHFFLSHKSLILKIKTIAVLTVVVVWQVGLNKLLNRKSLLPVDYYHLTGNRLV